jgi:hypothetical protein
MHMVSQIWRKRFVKYSLAIVGLWAVIAIGIIGYREYVRAQNLAALAEARARWEARNFEGYRIVFEWENSWATKYVSVTVDQVALANRTPDVLPWLPFELEEVTVSQLFELIEVYIAETQCGVNGCVCDGYVAIDVEYDEQLGYPIKIDMRLDLGQWWLYPGDWFEHISPHECIRLLQRSSEFTIRVVSLAPLYSQG